MYQYYIYNSPNTRFPCSYDVSPTKVKITSHKKHCDNFFTANSPELFNVIPKEIKVVKSLTSPNGTWTNSSKIFQKKHLYLDMSWPITTLYLSILGYPEIINKKTSPGIAFELIMA